MCERVIVVVYNYTPIVYISITAGVETTSDCTRRASRMRQQEWEEIGRRVSVDCGRRGFTDAIC